MEHCEERIAALEAQIVRLQRALREIDRDWADSEGFGAYADDEVVELYHLEPGDMDTPRQSRGMGLGMSG